MRLWLSAFIALFLSISAAPAQQPFPGAAPVKFSFRETLKDKVAREPDTPIADESFIRPTERTLTITGSAPLTGFNLLELDDLSPYSIVIGEFDTGQISGLQGRLSDDEDYFSETSRRIDLPLLALNYDGDEVKVGNIAIFWNTVQVEFSVQLNNVNQALTEIDLGVAAEYYREREETIDAEDLTAAFSFGPFSYNLRTVYTVGNASFSSDARVSELLSDVSVFGAIDYLPPVATVTSPAGNTSTSFDTVTIVGTVSDSREIRKGSNVVETFAGEVASVEVQVGTPLNPGQFATATLNGSNWQLPNAPLEAGENRIVVRATDVHGNFTTTAPRKITYLLKGTVTVEAEATGFPAEASGPAGTVKGAFLPTSITVQKTGNEVPTISARNISAGQQFTVTAVPAPGAVFNGWTATLGGTPHFTALTEKLTFETKPNLFLRAAFVPSPFEPLSGIYHGLVTGGTAADRGTFKVTIGKTGAFTGKMTAGRITLPIKGKVIGSGRWAGVVKKGAAEHAVEFSMNLSGDRQLNGTLTGGGLSSAFTADLNSWRKPRGTDLGNLATEYAAAYNVALTPPDDASAAMPKGIGFGRVTISPMGAVRFRGKLGDGSAAAFGGTLIKRISGPVTFPLFIPLEKGFGNLSGMVDYSLQPSTDLTATLNWSEPTTKKVEPQAFSGTVALSGSRYTPPVTGGFAILGGTNGSGFLGLTSRAYLVPAIPAGELLDRKSEATLDPAKHVVTLDPSEATAGLAFKMKIAPKTGLFSGSFKDPQLARTIKFAGAVQQKANGGLGFGGGVFTRGNRAGAVHFGPPPPP